MPSQTHFLHAFSTFVPAGPQLRSAALMIAMGKGIRHSVIACSGTTETADWIGDRADLRLLKPEAKGGPAGFARGIAQVLRDERPDLLLTYNWGSMDAVIAARMVGHRAHVHHEDGFNSDEAERLLPRRNWTRRLLLKRAEIVVPSRRLEGIARDVWKLPKLHYIANGVHLEPFARDAARGAAFRAKLGIPAEAFVIGTVAHLRPIKRLDRLIRAAAAMQTRQPVWLVVVGEGSEGPALRELAQTSRPPGGQVLFAGHLDQTGPAYSAFDALALSSASEQQPVSVLEAIGRAPSHRVHRCGRRAHHRSRNQPKRAGGCRPTRRRDRSGPGAGP
ncbi:MAG: glycosyltransferase [Planctomycetota bacterium]